MSWQERHVAKVVLSPTTLSPTWLRFALLCPTICASEWPLVTDPIGRGSWRAYIPGPWCITLSRNLEWSMWSRQSCFISGGRGTMHSTWITRRETIIHLFLASRKFTFLLTQDPLQTSLYRNDDPCDLWSQTDSHPKGLWDTLGLKSEFVGHTHTHAHMHIFSLSLTLSLALSLPFSNLVMSSPIRL